jgi:hypothetical protein
MKVGLDGMVVVAAVAASGMGLAGAVALFLTGIGRPGRAATAAMLTGSCRLAVALPSGVVPQRDQRVIGAMWI